MSYDLYIVDVHGNKMQSPFKHDIRGGTYCIGGTDELWLSVTFNYAQAFSKAFENDRGIKLLHGMPCLQSIPIILAAMTRLGDDVTDRYWDATEGNAKKALWDCIQLAALGCDGFWELEY